MGEVKRTVRTVKKALNSMSAWDPEIAAGEVCLCLHSIEHVRGKEILYTGLLKMNKEEAATLAYKILIQVAKMEA